MKAELRADGLHVSGYVNVPGRQSRPVMTPNGKMIEVIEQRAFSGALGRAGNIRLLLDHNGNRELASTANATLRAKEDEIGLRADAVITDQEVMAAAKEGKLRGWSFNMRHVKDWIEERADKLPLRHVTEFDMDEISLVLHKTPVYSSTSVEVRADEEEDVELRTFCMDMQYTENVPKNKVDYSSYEERIKALEH